MDTDLMSSSGDLGRRVTQRRMELGLTRDEVAARAGMAPNYLTYLETQVAHIGSSGLARLAGALQTTVDELLGGPPSPLGIPTDAILAGNRDGGPTGEGGQTSD
jgi:transcriptional regulator with XRE-family HTH domain